MDNDNVPLVYPNTEVECKDSPPQAGSSVISLTTKKATTIMYPVANASAPIAHTGPLLLGPENTNVDCPFCQSQIRTTVKYTDHTGTHIAAAIWGRLCCLCCIPYCSDSAKNADHYCPSCQKYLGTYRT